MNTLLVHLSHPHQKALGERFFRFWLWLRSKDPIIEEYHPRVYSGGDMIDTLGSDLERGKWTQSYSDEGYSSYGIRIPFTSKWLTLVVGAWQHDTFVIETHQPHPND